MKKAFLLLFFGSLIGSSQSYAQRDSVYYKNHFYLNPLDLIFSNFEVSYERDLKKDRTSFMLTSGVFLQHREDEKTESGFNVELQYRVNMFTYPPSKNGFRSNIFFAPYINFRYKDYEDLRSGQNYIIQPFGGKDSLMVQKTDANLRSYGAGIVMGIRLTAFNNRFCFGIYGGGGLKYSNVKGFKSVFDNSIVDGNYTGITPKFSVQMGLAF